MKTIIIARVSSKHQDSNEAQLSRITERLKGKDLVVWKTFEIEESSTKADRKKFQAVIEIIRKENECIALVVDNVDRLQRSFKESVMLDDLRKAGKVELHFLREGLVINKDSNSADLLRWDMAVMFARSYVLQLSDNVKRKLEQKRRDGEWSGQSPLGYKNFQDILTEKKDVIVDTEKDFLIIKMFQLYATGNYSLEKIRIEITKAGLRSKSGLKLGKSYVEKILKDSFYCGLAISHKYGVYPHKYPRLISKELFDKCQEVRAGRTIKPNKEISKDYIFKGLIKCSVCGCSYTPEHHKKNNYYSCTNAKETCKRVYVNEKVLLKPIYELLDKFESITEETQNYLVSELRKTNESEVAFHQSQLHRIRDDEDKQNKRKENLLNALLDESITKPDYDKKLHEITDKLQLLRIEHEEHAKADHNYQTTVAQVLFVARRAKQIFESSETNEKRDFINYLVQNPYVKEKNLYFTMRSPFDLVLKLSERPDLLPVRDSNPNSRYQKPKSYH